MVVLLYHSAVKSDAGYGDFSGLLGENEVLQYRTRFVRCAVQLFYGSLYLVAGQWYFVGDDAFEIRLGGELGVGQSDTHPCVDAVGEQHGFLLHYLCPAGCDVDEEVTSRDAASGLLKPFLLWRGGRTAGLVGCFVLLPAMVPALRLQTDGLGMQRASTHPYRSGTNGDVAAFARREDVGVCGRGTVGCPTVDHLIITEG